MKCPKCGQEFEGNFCPNCGMPVQNNIAPQQPVYQNPCVSSGHVKKKLRAGQIAGITFGSIILFIVLICILATMFPGDSESSNSTVVAGTAANSIQQVSSEPDVLKVDYATLYKDYTDNPINADKKYRDKKLQVSGTISTIGRDVGQTPYITFNVDEYGAQTVKMAFDSDDVVASFQKGQSVTVQGTCSGIFMSTVVEIDNCSVIE